MNLEEYIEFLEKNYTHELYVLDNNYNEYRFPLDKENYEKIETKLKGRNHDEYT